MHFYCYSTLNDAGIAKNLGATDYSYYFVLKAYLPLLESLGTVELVSTLDDALAADYRKQVAGGAACFILAFVPPPKIPSGFPFPILPVFAWEYSTLPSSKELGSEEGCWETALSRCGAAISLSNYGSQVAGRQLGGKLIIESIPAPVHSAVALEDLASGLRRAVKNTAFAVSASVIDTRDYVLSAESLYPAEGVSCPLVLDERGHEAAEYAEIEFGKNQPGVATFGFHAPEGWGAWSKADNPWIVLPGVLLGSVRLTLTMMGFGPNIGREITIHAGAVSLSVVLSGELQSHVFDVTLAEPVNFLRFAGVDHRHQAGGGDTRTLGLGLGAVGIQPLAPGEGSNTTVPAMQQLGVQGIVYTSVFNPRDGRKNWEDILTGFCYAFREEARATLILKMTCQSTAEYLDNLFELLSQLHPFSCRVIVLQGYLQADEFSSLLESTSYVVNASRGEGQCLPLLEFMAAGVPAIAPDNTAMAEYIFPDCAFLIDSTPEPTFWPEDKNQLKTCLWYRPSWESLFDAYRRSFKLAVERDDEYAAMSLAAVERVHRHCSVESLSDRLQQFLTVLEQQREPS